MAGWDNKPDGWEDTHGRYNLVARNQYKDLLLQQKKDFDVIVVMAGGLTDEGKIHPWVENRLNLALDLYKERKTFIICTGGGTYHKPPFINEERFVIHEATACAEYLINNGVDPSHIIKEWGSYDTIASVYFTLLLCIIPRSWNHICVITSSFHMPRVELLFRWIFGFYDRYDYTFLDAHDDDLDEEIIAIRKERERESVRKMEILQDKIRSKEEFNRWLFTEHKAYSCNVFPKDEISDDQKRSY